MEKQVRKDIEIYLVNEEIHSHISTDLSVQDMHDLIGQLILNITIDMNSVNFEKLLKTDFKFEYDNITKKVDISIKDETLNNEILTYIATHLIDYQNKRIKGE